jgi:hypothetical protein
MKYNLFLDDIRNPEGAIIYERGMMLCDVSGIPAADWLVVRTHEDFVKIIEHVGIPEVVSFDHDLCFEHMRYYCEVTQHQRIIDYDAFKTPTGKSSAEYLVEQCKNKNQELPICFIHSANEIGGRNIQAVLN